MAEASRRPPRHDARRGRHRHNLENYPVPIRLDKTNFDFAQAKPDGSDLRFAKADGPLLAHEIELWDSISRNRT